MVFFHGFGKVLFCLVEKEDRMWAGGLTVRELVNQKDTFS